MSKAGLLSRNTREQLNNLVLNIFIPANIFSAFQRGITPEMLSHSLIILMVAFGLQAFVFVLNKFLYIKIAPEKALIFKYATINNNAASLGLPVLGAVFGDIGILYGSIFLIPMRILMWTSWLSLFTKVDRKNKIKNLITHPCILAVVVGFVYVFIPLSLPAFISNAIWWVGDVARVLPMIVVGSILSELKIKEALDKDCFYYSFFRLVAIPAVMFVVLRLLSLDPVLIGVSVLLAAMPAAMITATFADKYNRNPEFASKTIFVSTILSIATLPLIALALERFVPTIF